MAEAAPALTPATEHVLADGLHVLVRPVVASDRDELAAGYEKLSSRSRHTRFFSPPDELSADDLDYLTQLDYHDHYALAAFAVDLPGSPGVAVARYVRDHDNPSSAEVAITVLDEYQRRGLGVLLMELLADVAAVNDVRTFVFFVLWQNDNMIELLRQEGARVEADEPGVARIELDLDEPGKALPEPTVHYLLRTLAERARDVLGDVGS